MVDDVLLNSGTGGDTIGADDIGGVKFQRVKLIEGADGTNDGDISATNPLPVESPNVAASGALGAANDAVTLSGHAWGTINWEIDTGTLSGTVVFEGTLDDTNWFAINAMRIDGVIIANTTTFADRGMFTSVGYSQVRLRVSAWTSGTSNARVEGSRGANGVRIAEALPAGNNNIGNVDIVSLPDEGQQTMANSISVAVASDQSAVPVSAASLPLPAGAATSAAQLADGHNVTVDNAGAGAAVNIQDGGNSLTVDAPVATPANVQISDGTDTALVSAAGGLIVDGSGVTQPISAVSLPLPAGAATSAAQLAAGHTVTADAGTGDFLSITGHVRNEGFKESNAIGGELDDTTPVAATEGNVSPVRITAQRGLHVNLRNNAGAELGTTGNPVVITDDGNAVIVNGSAVTQPVSAASLPLPAGAATSAAQLANGHDVTIDNAGAGAAVNIQDGGNIITVDGTVTADAGTGTRDVGGVAAHGASVSGNPVLLSGEGRTTNPTAVTDGQVVRLQADDQGRLVVVQSAPRDLVVKGRITLATTTETTVIAAAVATFHDLTTIMLSNEGATEVRVDIRDATAGTPVASYDLAADGGGVALDLNVPMPQGVVNNNWTVQLSAAVSTVYITLMAVKRV